MPPVVEPNAPDSEGVLVELPKPGKDDEGGGFAEAVALVLKRLEVAEGVADGKSGFPVVVPAPLPEPVFVLFGPNELNKFEG